MAFEIDRGPVRCTCEHEAHFPSPADEAKLALLELDPQKFAELEAQTPTIGGHPYLKGEAVAMVDTAWGVWPHCLECVEARHGALDEFEGETTYRVEFMDPASQATYEAGRRLRETLDAEAEARIARTVAAFTS